jgi:hypothetical protein
VLRGEEFLDDYQPGTNSLYRNGFTKNPIRYTVIGRPVQQGARAKWGNDGISVIGLRRHNLILDVVVGRLEHDGSFLFLSGVSAAMGHIGIPCVLLS